MKLWHSSTSDNIPLSVQWKQKDWAVLGALVIRVMWRENLESQMEETLETIDLSFCVHVFKLLLQQSR